jgi:preprotein translocase subunit SecB
MTDKHAASGQESTEGQDFFIHKVLLEDVSFEAPHTPQIFQKKWAPTAEIEVNTQVQPLDKSNYHVSIVVTITAKNDSEVAFLVQLKQSGIFALLETNQEKLSYILNAYCPSILFPYARENISGLVTRGGFPQINIAPINFDALYARAVQEEMSKKSKQ